MAKDQAEADEDMSLKQRLVLAAGSTLTGASEMVDNEIIAGAMEVGGRLEVHGCSVYECVWINVGASAVNTHSGL